MTAVPDRRDPRRRHGPRGRARGPEGPRGRSRVEGFDADLVEFDLGGERYLRTGDVLPDDELARMREMDAILLGAVGDPRREAGHPRARPAAARPLRARPVREPAAGRPVPGRADARPEPQRGRRELRRRARELRGPVQRRGRVPPQGHRSTRSPCRSRSTPATASSASCATRSSSRCGPTGGGKLTLVHKTNVLTFAGDLYQRVVDEVAAEYPRRRDRLRARRRRVHLLPGSAAAVRRDRHRQHVRRHHHGPRRDDPGRHGHRGRAATSTRRA